MDLMQLMTTARRRLDDVVAPYLWSREDLIEYANDAQREACRRSRLIVDSTTPSICQIALVAGTPTYALDERIIFIKRAKLTGHVTPLGRAHSNDLDNAAPGWEDDTGVPRAYVPNMDTNTFRPYPTPDDAYTANLTVIRTPLVEMDDEDQTPEIASRYHIGLVNWMLHRAWMKTDSETYNPKAAAEAEAMFESEFGKRSSAQDESWIAREHGYFPEEGVY